MMNCPIEHNTRILSILLPLLNLVCLAQANFNSSTLLYKKFLTDIDYRVRPSLNASVPTEVGVEMNLVSLREIVETQQYFTVNAWLEFIWKDEIRTWDPEEYDGVQVIYPNPKDTWRPRIITANSIQERDLFADDYTSLAILWDGTTRWYPGSMFSLSCSLDLTYFPFDSQACTLWFVAQYFSWDVHLNPARSSVNSLLYLPNGEWSLESSRLRNDTVLYKGIPLDYLYIDITFRRRPTFYLMNFLVPVILMSLMSPLVFVLPEDGGERASYSVTLLLALSVSMGIVSEKLPQSSQPLPLTVIYIFTLLIHSGLCVVCTVVHLRWLHRREHPGRQATGTSEPRNDQQKQGQQFRLPRLIIKASNDTNDNIQRSWATNKIGNGSHTLSRKEEDTGAPYNFDFDGKRIISKSVKRALSYLREKLESMLCCCDISIVLLALFYASWFAISIHFFVRFTYSE